MKKIYISSDHAGFKLKEYLKNFCQKKIKFFDLGPTNNKSVDYPIYAHKVAKKVKINKNNVGILVCGSGTGMSITANKHKNIRLHNVLALNQQNYLDCIMMQILLH